MQWVGGWRLCDQSTGVGRGWLLYLVTEAKLACFDYFFSHLLRNPVRYLGVSLQNGILWARPGKSSVISWILTDFQAFGPWYLSEFARRWPLRFWLEHGHRPCSSHCGRSKCRGLAVKACISKLPRDCSNSGWVALSCVSKSQGWVAILFETLTAVRVCGRLKWIWHRRLPWGVFPGLV